jgi:hypothetical protein
MADGGFLNFSLKILATFPKKTKKLVKMGIKMYTDLRTAQSARLKQEQMWKFRRFFERVVGVAGRLEVVQVLHLYAANVGTKIAEICYC